MSVVQYHQIFTVFIFFGIKEPQPDKIIPARGKCRSVAKMCESSCFWGGYVL